MALELEDMRSLIVMARHRSLRQAAIEMNVRQSTLSRRLHAMDGDLGVHLFERSTAGTRLTAVGHEFLAKARQIVEEADTAFAKLRTRALGKSGQLTIGVYTSFSAGNLRATLLEHRERFPMSTFIRWMDSATICSEIWQPA
ncbi:MAG: LysR family transcriptional regulator [Methylovirgula sp.]